jgi:hypothetical protein
LSFDTHKPSYQNDTSSVLDFDYHRLKTESGRYDWDGYLNQAIIKPILLTKREKGVSVTIRGLCYILESKGVIPKQDFNKAYRALATARKNGSIDKDFFVDNTRHIIKKFDDRYLSVSDQIDDAVNYVQELPMYAKENIPRWYNQPYYVEVWVEKDAFANLIFQILKDRHVIVVPNKGWSSITFMYDNIERLVEKIDTYQQDLGLRIKVQVLYFGDLDPSGWAMDKLYRKELEKKFGWRNFNPESEHRRVFFKRAGVTKEQIDQPEFNLKHLTNPDPALIEKLNGNSNAEAFKEEFGSLFQIELEALESSPYFEDMVRNEVDILYNDDVYEQVLNLPENKFTIGEIKEAIVDRLKERFSF